MAGEVGSGNAKCQVSRIRSDERLVTPEDVWNAAVRAAADPARMALSLVLGEVTLAESTTGKEDEPVQVRDTLKEGLELVYDASLLNPFKDLGK